MISSPTTATTADGNDDTAATADDDDDCDGEIPVDNLYGNGPSSGSIEGIPLPKHLLRGDSRICVRRYVKGYLKVCVGGGLVRAR